MSIVLHVINKYRFQKLQIKYILHAIQNQVISNLIPNEDTLKVTKELKNLLETGQTNSEEVVREIMAYSKSQKKLLQANRKAKAIDSSLDNNSNQFEIIDDALDQKVEMTLGDLLKDENLQQTIQQQANVEEQINIFDQPVKNSARSSQKTNKSKSKAKNASSKIKQNLENKSKLDELITNDDSHNKLLQKQQQQEIVEKESIIELQERQDVSNSSKQLKNNQEVQMDVAEPIDVLNEQIDITKKLPETDQPINPPSQNTSSHKCDNNNTINEPQNNQITKQQQNNNDVNEKQASQCSDSFDKSDGQSKQNKNQQNNNQDCSELIANDIQFKLNSSEDVSKSKMDIIPQSCQSSLMFDQDALECQKKLAKDILTNKRNSETHPLPFQKAQIFYTEYYNPTQNKLKPNKSSIDRLVKKVTMSMDVWMTDQVEDEIQQPKQENSGKSLEVADIIISELKTQIRRQTSSASDLYTKYMSSISQNKQILQDFQSLKTNLNYQIDKLKHSASEHIHRETHLTDQLQQYKSKYEKLDKLFLQYQQTDQQSLRDNEQQIDIQKQLISQLQFQLVGQKEQYEHQIQTLQKSLTDRTNELLTLNSQLIEKLDEARQHTNSKEIEFDQINLQCQMLQQESKQHPDQLRNIQSNYKQEIQLLKTEITNYNKNIQLEEQQKNLNQNKKLLEQIQILEQANRKLNQETSAMKEATYQQKMNKNNQEQTITDLVTQRNCLEAEKKQFELLVNNLQQQLVFSNSGAETEQLIENLKKQNYQLHDETKALKTQISNQISQIKQLQQQIEKLQQEVNVEQQQSSQLEQTLQTMTEQFTGQGNETYEKTLVKYNLQKEQLINYQNQIQQLQKAVRSLQQDLIKTTIERDQNYFTQSRNFEQQQKKKSMNIKPILQK